MKLTTEDKKNLGQALERHRLYLLAKNDYEQFKSLVGADRAKSILADLKTTRRMDTKLCKNAYLYTYRGGGVGSQVAKLVYAADNTIRKDAEKYAKGNAGKAAMGRMKLHLGWCLLTHIILLTVAVCYCAAPWKYDLDSIVINNSTATEISIACIILFLLLLWFANAIVNLLELRTNLGRLGLFSFSFIPKKTKFGLIVPPVLILGAANMLITTYQGASGTQISFYRDIAIAVVALAHAFFILDCMAGLSPRSYFFCPEGFFDWVKGWFKGEFSLSHGFTRSLSNSYEVSNDFECTYRDKELVELERAMRKKGTRWLYLNSGYGQLELHPSSSMKFITAYILVDIFHTACLIGWMYTLFSLLATASAGYAFTAATASCAIVCVLLERPVCATNRFHWNICKNMYAYRVSHLFRKLLFSIIILAGIIGLSILAGIIHV